MFSGTWTNQAGNTLSPKPLSEPLRTQRQTVGTQTRALRCLRSLTFVTSSNQRKCTKDFCLERAAAREHGSCMCVQSTGPTRRSTPIYTVTRTAIATGQTRVLVSQQFHIQSLYSFSFCPSVFESRVCPHTVSALFQLLSVSIRKMFPLHYIWLCNVTSWRENQP